MTKQPGSPREQWRLTEDERAELEARLSDPERPAREVDWVDDGPDPFGMDWRWGEPVDGESRVDAVPTLELDPPDDGARVLRFPAYIGGAALAASLLIAFGALLANRFGGGVNAPLAFAVTLGANVVRGPEAVGSLTVENRSRSRAFVTIVGLRDGENPAVHYREDQQFIDVKPNGTRVVGNLPASFDEATALIVALTATPAGEAVRQLAPDLPHDMPEVARDALLEGLEAFGFEGSAAEVVIPGDNEG